MIDERFYDKGASTMNEREWTAHMIWAVARSANGHPERLQEIAQRLEDGDTATESLLAHGYGKDGDGLLDIVALVVTEGKEETA